MAEVPDMSVQPLPSPEPSDPPIASLAYAVRLSHPLTPAVRALGLACVFLAAIGLARLPLVLISANRQFRISTFEDQNAFRVVFLLALLASLVNHILQMIAGISCIRARPTAGRRLRIWAWSEIICTLLYLAANFYFQFHSVRSSYILSMRFESCALLVERAIVGVTVPVFALIMVRSPSFSQAVVSSG